MNKICFLDKDGTLVDNSQYPDIIPSDKILKDDIIEGLKYLQEQGYKLIIISNQSWISKGRHTEEQTENIFKSLIKQLELYNIHIEAYFYCPHLRTMQCECKKPNNKLILDALKKYKGDSKKSLIIGDMDRDILAGKKSGIKTVLVQTGCGNQFLDCNPDHIIKNINQIGEIINESNSEKQNKI